MSNTLTAVHAPLVEFNDLGVPQTVIAARSMSQAAIRRAVLNVVAYLEETDESEVAGWPTGPDGSIEVDSQLGVDIYNEFVGHLGPSRLKLDQVDQQRWASIDGLTDVLAASFSKMAGSK